MTKPIAKGRRKISTSHFTEEQKFAIMAHLNPLVWIDINKLMLRENTPFTLKWHRYQKDILECKERRQCIMKGAQLGATQMHTLLIVHGMIHGRYPQGVFYLFPTTTHAMDFSREKFDPMIANNPCISQHVKNISGRDKKTDNATMKRLGNSFLYLRGARVTQKIGGESGKKSSLQLKSNSADCVVFDEVDEMDPSMVSQALARMYHSEIKEEKYLSTPTIPDFGISALYEQSDKRVWMIKCRKCAKDTCLELEFPDCIKERSDGTAYRACIHCGAQIYQFEGRWETRYPGRSKDMVGWWISALNSHYMDPTEILKSYRNPPNGNLGEVYNSILGLPYIAIENRLTKNAVLACCGDDQVALRDDGPSAMGVDCGRDLHVVIGHRPNKKVLKVVKITTVSSFDDLHDLGKRYGVKCAVIDKYPETHAARSFAESQNYKAYLCGYQDGKQHGPTAWDDRGMEIKGNRTELLDGSHNVVTDSGRLELPRVCKEVNDYAAQMCGVAKVLEEDVETGAKYYRYRRLPGGQGDHYRHATNYFMLASEKVGIKRKNAFIQKYMERRFNRARSAMAA